MFTQFHKNIAYLRNNGTPWMFPALPESLQTLVPQNTEFKPFRKNKIIIKENEYPDQLIYVKTGCVCISYVNDYLEKNILLSGLCSEGGLTASMGNFAKYLEYNRIEIFSKNTVVGFIPFASIENAISKDRSLHMEYINYAACCDRARLLTLKVNASYPPHLRYILYIVSRMIAKKTTIPEPDKDVWFPVTYPAGRHRHHITLNVSKSTIDRMLARWKSKGYYKYMNNIHHIHASSLAELNNFSLQNS